MKTMNLVLGFLVLTSISAANAANGEKVAYMDAASIEAQNSAIVKANISPKLALERVQELMSTCGFPAGNEARTAQLSNLKMQDIQLIGTATLVRNDELEPSLQTPEFVSVEMYYKIPAAHGADDLLVGVGFKTKNLSGIEVSVNSDDVQIFRVPVMGSKKVVKLEGLQPMTARLNCHLTSEEVQRVVQQ